VEGVEDPFLLPAGDPGSAIRDLDPDAPAETPPRDREMGPGEGEGAALGHRAASVVEEVHEHLHEGVAVARDRERRVAGSVDPGSRLPHAGEGDLRRRIDELADRVRAELERRVAREGHQVRDDAVEVLDRTCDAIEALEALGFFARIGRRGRRVASAFPPALATKSIDGEADPAERVAELVGDAGRDAAERLEALAALELAVLRGELEPNLGELRPKGVVGGDEAGRHSLVLFEEATELLPLRDRRGEKGRGCGLGHRVSFLVLPRARVLPASPAESGESGSRRNTITCTL